MSSMIDSLFDQYETGKLTRRNLVQALAALALPATMPLKALAQTPAPSSAPLVHAYGVNHIGLTVADVERSFVFYEKLFGVTKGWPATDTGTPGIHLDLPDGYISVDSASEKKGVITHFSIATDPFDM